MAAEEHGLVASAELVAIASSAPGFGAVEEPLQAEMLAAIVESSDDAIISKTLDGIIRTWNAAATRIFGYTPQEAIGKPITLIIPPELHAEELQILKNISRGERIDHLETVRVTKDGRRTQVSLTVSPIRNRSGRVIGASKNARDITEQRRLERTRALLAAIVESSDDAIISKNLDGIIQTWNAAATRILATRRKKRPSANPSRSSFRPTFRMRSDASSSRSAAANASNLRHDPPREGRPAHSNLDHGFTGA